MKKSYVFNTLICCGCTALIFLLHFIVYGGVLLKSPGYTGLFCAVSRKISAAAIPSRWSRRFVRIPLCAFVCGSCYTASF